jgi:hypothetical protein
MEIGACFREVRLLVTIIIIIVRRQSGCFIVRRQFCVFQHRSTVAGENQKPGSKSMFAAIFACRDLFLSGPIPIPVALGRIKSTCNAETWNFHPRFASPRYTQDRAGTVGQVGYSDVFQPFVRRRCWCYDCRAARFHHFQNRQKHP